MNIRLREVMLPMLTYPILIPALMGAMQLTMRLGGRQADLGRENVVWLHDADRLRRDLHGGVPGAGGNGASRVDKLCATKFFTDLGVVAVLLLIRDIYSIIMRAPRRSNRRAISSGSSSSTCLSAITACCCAARQRWSPASLFLVTKNFRYDAAGGAVTEVGLAFLAANLVTGSIWGRVIWGIWWTWDARLTSALVCWLLYAGYLMLRRAIEEPTAARHLRGGVFTFSLSSTCPSCIFSIKWWRTQHPQPVFWGGGSFPSDWLPSLPLEHAWPCCMLGTVFTMIRLRQEETQRELDSLRRLAHAM